MSEAPGPLSPSPRISTDERPSGGASLAPAPDEPSRADRSTGSSHVDGDQRSVGSTSGPSKRGASGSPGASEPGRSSDPAAPRDDDANAHSLTAADDGTHAPTSNRPGPMHAARSDVESPPAELAASTAAAAPAHPWLDAGRPARVLLVGDSMIATDFGRELEAHLREHADVVTYRRGRSSSGLARPDYFDWFELGAQLARRFRPDVVVVVLGGNDGQDLRPKTEGRWVHWRSDGWAEAYQARLHRFLDGMAGPGRRFAWIELPAMAHRGLENKLKTIRRVQSEALAQRDDLLAEIRGRPCFYAKDRLLESVPDGPDAGAPLRLEDGIHFTVAGARHYAACVGPVLRRHLPPKPPADDAS